MVKERYNWSGEPWQEAEPLECVMMVPETADAATFTFRAPSGAWRAAQSGDARADGPRLP